VQITDKTTFVSTASPVTMDKCDYRGQSFAQVASDCADASGKNWFVWIRRTGPSTRKVTAWYGKGGSSLHTSPLWLTNDASDVVEARIADGRAVAWPIAPSTRLRRSPGRVYSGAYGEFDGFSMYRHRAATESAYGGTRRDMSLQMANVKTKPMAAARLDRMLLDVSTQEERITTAVNLPNTLVSSLRVGMRVPFRALHLPGYSDAYKWTRVLNCQPQPVGDGSRYDVGLELAGGPGLGGPGGGPPFVPEWVWEGSVSGHTDTIPADAWTGPVEGRFLTGASYQFEVVVYPTGPAPDAASYGFATAPWGIGGSTLHGWSAMPTGVFSDSGTFTAPAGTTGTTFGFWSTCGGGDHTPHALTATFRIWPI
jgi:hypothetical protein